jgi:hypothetical protein
VQGPVQGRYEIDRWDLQIFEDTLSLQDTVPGGGTFYLVFEDDENVGGEGQLAFPATTPDGPLRWALRGTCPDFRTTEGCTSQRFVGFYFYHPLTQVGGDKDRVEPIFASTLGAETWVPDLYWFISANGDTLSAGFVESGQTFDIVLVRRL